METRKLQQVGGGTYTVSIPKGWAVEHGLEAGSEVHLYAHADDSIVVRSSRKDGDELDAVTIEVDGDGPELVTRALRAAHAVGYETVTLLPRREFTAEQRRVSRRTKRHLVGTEIIVEGDAEITLQSLLDAADVSVRQSVVQLQFVAVSIHRRATAGIAESGGVDDDRFGERADEAERLFQMITRHFSRSQLSMAEVDRLGSSRSALFDYYATASELKRVADLAVAIGRATGDLSMASTDPLADAYRDVGTEVGTVVDEAATAVLEGPDVAKAHHALDAHDHAVAAIDELDRTAFDEPSRAFDGSTYDARSLTRVLDAQRRTAGRGSSIAAVAIQASTRPDGS